MKRRIAGLLVGAALLGGTLAYEIPQAHATTPPITITCSNGYTITVNAHAAGGILKALNNFNAYSHTGVTCSAG
jgi:hypothetical protein